MKAVCSSVLLSAGMVVPGMACDLCSVYSAAQARGEIGHGYFAGASEQFTHFGTMQLDGRKVADPVGQYMDSSISQIFAGYNFNDRFGIQANVPIIYRSFKRPEGFAIDQGSESGLGDFSLFGNFQIIRHEEKRRTLTWSVLGGVKFPTGESDRLAEELNEVEVPGAPESGIHGHDLARGSGSFDGLVGTRIFGRYERWFGSAGLQYAIRTKGDFDYRYANDLTWTAGPGYYLILNDNYTVALQFNVLGEEKGLDTFQGAKAEDTGITAVYVGPQFSLSWSDKFSADLAVDLPVVMDNTSLQAVPDYRIRAGMTWHF